MVRCGDDTLYTGITTNVEKRIHVHNTSKNAARYTKSRRPIELIYTETAMNRSGALKREYAIKQLDREAKLHLVFTHQNTKEL